MNKVLTNINQDLSALEKQTARSNIGAEDASNRVTSIDENSTDAQYPSAKCMFNALQNVGGGGYKDGGQLVDGDFIEVKNNTVSSYDNVSRDPVNFYFDVADGEVLNSVVELTTAVNATVNVYVLKNGFYYLIGNVGGNTVNAGDDYNLNVVGNSFMLEVVTPSPSIPEYVELAGEIVPVLKVNNILWACADLRGTEYSYRKIGDVYYYTANKNIVVNGWRIPTLNELITLNSTYNWQKLRSTSGWPSGYNGNNQSGFNAYPNGRILYGDLNGKGTENWLMVIYDGKAQSASMSYNNNYQYTFSVEGVPVRLVYDL